MKRKTTQTAFCMFLVIMIMFIIFTMTGCDKETNVQTQPPTLSDIQPNTADKIDGNRDEGKYSIKYAGLTNYLVTGLSSAEKGEEVTVIAEIPMEGLLVLYLNGEELRPSGTDENDRIIYSFTMPGSDVTIEFRIEA